MLCKFKPYEGDKPYIFFSYCHADAEKVYPLIEEMAHSGYRIWYDEGIHPGADWPDVIAQRLSDSQICMVAISPNSTRSHNCRNEMTFAVQDGKYLISLQLEDFILPLGIRLQLASTQMIKAFEYSKNELFEKIYSCEQLKECLGEKKSEIITENEKETKHKAVEETEYLHIETEKEVKHRAIEETEYLHIETEKEVKCRVVEDVYAQDDETIMQFEDDEVTIIGFDEDEDSDYTVLENSGNPPVFVRLNSNELFQGHYPLTSIGRSKSECDIYFESAKTMTSHHADIVIHDGHNFIIDRNSANGTYVNGERLEKEGRAEIQNYAEIWLSRTETFFIAFGKYADWIRENMYLISLLSVETRERLYLFESEIILGRSFSWASGAMTNKMIGRQHAIFQISDCQFYLTDKSRNGTYINDERIESNKPVLLKNGDRLRFGKEHFVFNHYVLKDGTIL